MGVTECDESFHWLPWFVRSLHICAIVSFNLSHSFFSVSRSTSRAICPSIISPKADTRRLLIVCSFSLIVPSRHQAGLIAAVPLATYQVSVAALPPAVKRRLLVLSQMVLPATLSVVFTACAALAISVEE